MGAIKNELEYLMGVGENWIPRAEVGPQMWLKYCLTGGVN